MWSGTKPEERGFFKMKKLPYVPNPRFSMDLASKLTQMISEAFSSNQPFDILALSAILEASTDQKIGLIKKVFNLNPYPIIPSLDKQFEASRYEFDMYVDSSYDHKNALESYRSYNPKLFDLFNKANNINSIKDANYAEKVDRLLPGKDYRVRLFRILHSHIDSISLYEILHFLRNQKSMIIGPQGLCQLHLMCKTNLPGDAYIVAPHVFDYSESSSIAIMHNGANNDYLHIKEHKPGKRVIFNAKYVYVLACYQK